jgi:hypothetical protein
MSVTQKTGKCPDCGEALHKIRMIDATQPTLRGKGAAHVDLSYALPDARPNIWNKALPISGIIRGFICEGCRRIFLYGEGDPIDGESSDAAAG